MAWNIVQGPDIGRWVAARCDGSYSPETCTAIGYQDDSGKIAAGVIYENCNGQSLVAHHAIAGRTSRAYWRAIFTYAFVTCGVHKIIGSCPSNHARADRIAKHMGFVEEARVRNAAPGPADLIIYTMEKAQCRFLGEDYGKT